MSLNELIAQSGKFQAPDLIGQYAAAQNLQKGMQQNALNTMKMDEMRRSLAEQEGVRNYLRSNPNLDTPEGLQGLNQYGGAGQKILADRIKQQQEMATARKSTADAGKTEYETARTKLTDSLKDAAGLTTPGAAIMHINNAVREGKIPQDKAEQLLATIPQDIEGFGKWRQQMMFNLLSAQNQLEQHFGTVDNGQTITQFSVPKYAPGAAPTAIVQQQKQLTPGAAEANETARKNVDLRERELNFNQDPVRQAAIAAAKKKATDDLKANADQVAVRAKELKGVSDVLNTIGYAIDPKTGIANDRVSDLIRKSTSGPAEYAGAKLYGLTGGATTGDVAIGQLQTYASKIAMDIMGGKLGAGVSNADREFIVQQLGDVANPLAPVEKRLGAWQEARDRMVKIKKNAEQTSPKASKLSPQDREALDWANKNPTDPRAIAIKQYHGG